MNNSFNVGKEINIDRIKRIAKINVIGLGSLINEIGILKIIVNEYKRLKAKIYVVETIFKCFKVSPLTNFMH